MENNNNFLQSDIWRQFQEVVGHKTFHLESEPPSDPPFGRGEGFSFLASVIEHQLPVVGKYFYIPRGPILCHSERAKRVEESNKLDPSTEFIPVQRVLGMTSIIDLAKKNNAGWIRIEPKNSLALDLIRSNWRVIKAPHDMQPREILVVDITKSEEELLAEMKPKTRYNIRLATRNLQLATHLTRQEEDINEFIRLVKITAKRNKITSHPESYYRKMLEIIPSDILKLYIAEYEGKIIAADLVIFFGDTATYFHGAMDDEYRNVMAPYLLQWQAIKDAKKAGYKFYDFGGISTNYLPTGQAGELNTNVRITDKWSGITKFKLGFAPATEPIIFPGSFDLVLNNPKYLIYRTASRLRNMISSIG